MLLLLLTMSLSPVRCTQHNWLKSFLKEYSYFEVIFCDTNSIFLKYFNSIFLKYFWSKLCKLNWVLNAGLCRVFRKIIFSHSIQNMIFFKQNHGSPKTYKYECFFKNYFNPSLDLNSPIFKVNTFLQSVR